MDTLFIKCPACGTEIHYGTGQHHAQCAYCGNHYNVPEGTPYVPAPEPEPVPAPAPEQKPETEPDEKDLLIFKSSMKTWRRDWFRLVLAFFVHTGIALGIWFLIKAIFERIKG